MPKLHTRRMVVSARRRTQKDGETQFVELELIEKPETDSTDPMGRGPMHMGNAGYRYECPEEGALTTGDEVVVEVHS